MKKTEQILVSPRVELARHISVPVLLLLLMTVPWFFGGREAFGHLLSAGLSLLVFLSWLVISRHRALRFSLRPIFVVGPLAILVGWASLSLLWTVSWFQSLTLLTTIFQASLAFVVARDVLHEDRAKEFFARLWALATLGVWVIGTALFMAGDYDRMTSLFYWANPLATYFLTGLVVSLFLVRSSRENDARSARFWLVVTGLLTSGLLLTYSRAAWLIGILVMSAIILTSPDRRAEAYRFAKVLALGCVVSAVIISARQLIYRQPTINIQSRVSESATSTSVKDRFQYWQEASVLFSERPLKGWGIGSYPEVHPQVQISPTTAGNNPHNSFLQSLVELGLVGGAAYLVLIGGWLHQGWLRLRHSQNDLALSAWLVVTVVVLHSWLDLVSNYPVLIMAGAIWMALALDVPEREFRLKHWPVAIPLVAAGSLILLGGFLSWNTYAAAQDSARIDATYGEDFYKVATIYQEMTDRPFYDADVLSQAAVSYIDHFDVSADLPASFLDPAKAYAERGIIQEPRDAKHAFALANVLERQGKVTEALASYRQAIRLDPHNNPQYQIGYARLLQREGFITEAIATLRVILGEYTPEVIANRNAIPMSQRIAVGQAVLADLYIAKADIGRAQQAIDVALKLSPQNPFVQQIKATLEATK